MTDVSGITGAGPLFHAIMEAAMQGRPRAPLSIAGSDRARGDGLVRVEVCALSGEIAGAACPHHLSEWRSEDDASGPPCTMHARVRVDRRNGLLAGPGCASDEVEERVVERFSPEMAAWADAAGRPVAPREWSPNCPGAGDPLASEGPPGSAPDTEGPRIAYPPAGARFVIDPDRPREAQRLPVHIVAPERAREATLVVDGAQVAKVGAPFDTSWPLQAGEHELVAEVDGRRSDAVRVSVRQ
jgi:penicillin-binding protein 1C